MGFGGNVMPARQAAGRKDGDSAGVEAGGGGRSNRPQNLRGKLTLVGQNGQSLGMADLDARTE